MGCEQQSKPSTPPASQTALQFVERAVVPATASDEAVVSLRTLNTSPVDARVVSIKPEADGELNVRYIGYSTCRGGCVGTGLWNDEETKALVAKGLEGTLPFDLPSLGRLQSGDQKPKFLVFSLRPAPESRALGQRCLRLHSVTVTLADGSRMKMTEPDGSWIAGIQLPEPRPANYLECSSASR